MTAKPPFEVQIASAAFNDIGDICAWTIQQFGSIKAMHYEGLINRAIKDLADDPKRTGAKPFSDLPADPWLYHLSFSRKNVPRDQVVKPLVIS